MVLFDYFLIEPLSFSFVETIYNFSLLPNNDPYKKYLKKFKEMLIHISLSLSGIQYTY